MSCFTVFMCVFTSDGSVDEVELGLRRVWGAQMFLKHGHLHRGKRRNLLVFLRWVSVWEHGPGVTRETWVLMKKHYSQHPKLSYCVLNVRLHAEWMIFPHLSLEKLNKICTPRFLHALNGSIFASAWQTSAICCSKSGRTNLWIIQCRSVRSPLAVTS